jgi:transcription elongation factor Elf1
VPLTFKKERKMSRISAVKVDVNFQCPKCDIEKSCNISEAIYNGAPMCQDCEEEMELIDCEIDTLI